MIKGAGLIAVLALAVTALGAGPSAAGGDETEARRAEMIAVIEAHARANRASALPNELSRPVIEALSRTPRHAFVPADERRDAYADRPLPIGYGQTISQPYIVALMTDLLAVGAGSRVLEIGTGSGYQAAVLAELGAEVHTIEIIAALAERAAERLRRLGYSGVKTRTGDGYFGWPEAAPFDGILVTAAANHVPPPLVAQLKPGGRMVIPVGPAFMVQQLVLVTKRADGGIETRQLLPVAFVPLTGGH